MRKAKLFKNGQSQAVRLPREFRFSGDEVYIKKSGECVVLIPVKRSWDTVVSSLDKFSNDVFDDRNQPGEQQERESL